MFLDPILLKIVEIRCIRQLYNHILALIERWFSMSWHEASLGPTEYYRQSLIFNFIDIPTTCVRV